MSVVRFLHKLLICVLVTALSMAQVDAATQRHVRANAKPGLYLLPGLEPFRAQVTQNSITAGSTPVFGTCTNGFNLYNNNGVVGCQANGAGSGTVSSVSWTGGIVSVATPTTTPAFTIAGTSGGIPYFSSASAWASSGLLSANALMIGGGAGTAPSTTTTGANVLTALGNAVNANGGVPNVDGAITTGHGLQWGPGVQDTGGIPGTVTSIATSCAISGGTLTQTGTLSSAILVNAQSGTTFTQATTDCGKLVTFSNAASIAVTLSNTNFVATNFFDALVLPGSVGCATFTPSSGVINSNGVTFLASVQICPGSPGGTFVFDGTNWEFSGTGLTQHQINVVTFSQLAKASTAAVTVGTDGSGYVTNDTITIATTGGTCSQAPVLTVTAAAGAITALAVTTPGSCTVLPTANPSTQATTSGVGTNGKAVITWAAITQTYTPTVGMTKVTTYTLGAAGGGGGGALQLASTAVSGGAGGAGGALYINEFTAATVGASQVITVGVQGTGGLADTINTTAGGTGGIGGFSRIGTLTNAGGGGGGAGGQLASASGGGGGGGNGQGGVGTTSGGAGSFPGGAGTVGAGSNATNPIGGTGGAGSPAVGGGGGAGGLNAWAGVGGGAGAGIPTGNTAGNGGGGGTPIGSGFSVPGGNGGTAGGTVAGSAGNTNVGTGTGQPIGFPGSGGGGGASATSGTAGAGGVGALGSGGGGGGSMTNGGTPGQGANGGAGQVAIVEFFN